MTFTFEETLPPADDIRRLYDSVGWSAYTSDLSSLMVGIENSTRVITAWDGQRLIGLARVISDLATIAYVQDILVDPTYQHRNIATELLFRVLEPFKVRQTVLLTGADPAQQSFYESAGFTEICDVGPDGLRSFVRLR